TWVEPRIDVGESRSFRAPLSGHRKRATGGHPSRDYRTNCESPSRPGLGTATSGEIPRARPSAREICQAREAVVGKGGPARLARWAWRSGLLELRPQETVAVPA